MNIPIGYLPNQYREFTEDDETYKFAVDNTFPYVLSVGVFIYQSVMIILCLAGWVILKHFLLYFYAEIFDSFLKNEYERFRNTSQIDINNNRG